MRDQIFALFLLILPLLIKSEPDKFKREIKATLNPECGAICINKGINIMYVKATSNNDVLHYLYAGGNFTETLSVVIIRSEDLNSAITINYDYLVKGLKNDVLQFKGRVDGAFGLIFTNLYEYYDADDTVKMKGDKVKKRTFNNIIWKSPTEDNKSFSFKSNSLKDINDTLLSKGNIEIKFSLSGVKKYGDGLPHLIFTGNNSHIDFILDTLKPTWDKSRFAIEVALINNITDGAMNIETVRSIDDEKSPGVFRINNFNGQSQNENWKTSTYLQWKPVCYLSNFDRSLNNISVTDKSDLIIGNRNNTDNNTIESSLAYLFFNDNMFNVKMGLVNISFGVSGDKFYNHSQYLIWTSSFGQGVAPMDTVSIAVIMVIAFGLGLPFLLVVIGSIYLIVKKRLKRKLSYEVIEDPIN